MVGNNFIDNNLNEIVLFSIAVLENHRDKGIASKLIYLFLDQVGNKRCILQVRESNIKAINLYKNLGFIEEYVKEKYYKDEENAIIMVRNKNLNIYYFIFFNIK